MAIPAAVCLRKSRRGNDNEDMMSYLLLERAHSLSMECGEAAARRFRDIRIGGKS